MEETTVDMSKIIDLHPGNTVVLPPLHLGGKPYRKTPISRIGIDRFATARRLRGVDRKKIGLNHNFSRLL